MHSTAPAASKDQGDKRRDTGGSAGLCGLRLSQAPTVYIRSLSAPVACLSAPPGEASRFGFYVSRLGSPVAVSDITTARPESVAGPPFPAPNTSLGRRSLDSEDVARRAGQGTTKKNMTALAYSCRVG